MNYGLKTFTEPPLAPFRMVLKLKMGIYPIPIERVCVDRGKQQGLRLHTTRELSAYDVWSAVLDYISWDKSEIELIYIYESRICQMIWNGGLEV